MLGSMTADSRFSVRGAVAGDSASRLVGGGTLLNSVSRQWVKRRGEEALKPLQRRYVKLCETSRPPANPKREVLLQLGEGQLTWNFDAVDREESVVVSNLLRTTEAQEHLTHVFMGKGSKGNLTTRKRVAVPYRTIASSSSMHSKDAKGEVLVFDALCSNLRRLSALLHLELDGLRTAFGSRGEGSLKLARGLRANKHLQSLSITNVTLRDSKAFGSLCAAIACHSTLSTLSLVDCSIRGSTGGRLLGVILKAHAGRRDTETWSAGLRKPYSYANTSVGAPPSVARRGLLVADFSGNKLGDAGAAELVKSLQVDSWLIALNLSRCELSDKAAVSFAECLVQNENLCALVLDENPQLSPFENDALQLSLHNRELPPVIIDEQQAVLLLSQWGYRTQTEGEDGSPMPIWPLPPPPDVVAPPTGGRNGAKMKAAPLSGTRRRSTTKMRQRKEKEQSKLIASSPVPVQGHALPQVVKKWRKRPRKIASKKGPATAEDTLRVSRSEAVLEAAEAQLEGKDNSQAIEYLESMVEELTAVLKQVEAAVATHKQAGAETQAGSLAADIKNQLAHRLRELWNEGEEHYS